MVVCISSVVRTLGGKRDRRLAEIPTLPGVTAHVVAASEKAGVQGGCPRGGVFEERANGK